jgi:hypothetical protein
LQLRRPAELQRPGLLSFSKRQLVIVPPQMRGLLTYLTESLSGRMHRYSRCSKACLPCLGWFSSFLGLVPQQQTGLQGMSALALAPTPTPVTAPASAPGTVSSPAGISFSALFSPLPQVSLFQSPVRPTLPESTSVPPLAVSEQP